MNELGSLLSHSFDEIKGNGKLIIELLRLSHDLLSLPYSDCEKQHRDYYEKLKSLINKDMADKINLLDKKYILKPGKVLYYNHTHFNNDTLTDKIAENAIKKFPALKGAFISDRERAVLEAKAAAKHNISDAEDSVVDEHSEEQIIELIDAEKFDEARELIPILINEETRIKATEAVNEGEEKVNKAIADAKKKFVADAKAKADAEAEEEKRLADEKAKDVADAKKKTDKEKADKKKAADAKAKKDKEDADQVKADQEAKAKAEAEAEKEEEPEEKPEEKKGLGKHS